MLPKTSNCIAGILDKDTDQEGIMLSKTLNCVIGIRDKNKENTDIGILEIPSQTTEKKTQEQ
jgi:hypothetical protein